VGDGASVCQVTIRVAAMCSSISCGRLRAQGNYDDAESFANLWLTAQRQTWGEHHESTLHAMEELADIYLTLARFFGGGAVVREGTGNSGRFQQHRTSADAATPGTDASRPESRGFGGASPSLGIQYHPSKIARRETSDGLAITRNLALALVERDKLPEAATIADSCLASIQQAHAAGELAGCPMGC